MIMNQSGPVLTGTLRFADTLGRGGVSPLQNGSFSLGTISFQYTDPDPACGSRLKTATGSWDGNSTTIALSSSAPSGGTCPAKNSNQPTTFTMVTANTYTASGTYSVSGTTLTTNWSSSNFVCNGPNVGTDMVTIVTLNSTTFAWQDQGGGSTTFTRASGEQSGIVGTWIMSDQSGNSYTLVIASNLTVSLTAQIASCGGGSTLSVQSQHWANGYYVHPQYDDPSHAASTVSVTGPGISGSLSLAYQNGQWESWSLPGNPISLGASHPAAPLTYSFTITPAPGGTTTAAASCFIEPFVTNPSVSKDSSGNIVFSWTKPAPPYTSMNYGVELQNPGGGNYLFTAYDQIDASSITYTGSLAQGTYNYQVLVSDANDSCFSFTQASFTVNPNGSISNPSSCISYLVDAGGNYSPTLTIAFSSAISSDVIVQLQAGTLPEPQPLIWNQNVAITLLGGFDCIFSSNLGFTTIPVSLTIANGTLTISNVILQ
jgi:hypothetical protein